LREHLQQDPDLALLLMRRLAAEKSEHRRHLIRLAQLPPRDRMASLLARLCERLMAPGPCRVPLTRQDLADHLGLSIVHTNRALGELRSTGLIETQADGVLVRDADRLRAAAVASHEAA
jgi:CRP-like cAMP-binding protein